MDSTIGVSSRFFPVVLIPGIGDTSATDRSGLQAADTGLPQISASALQDQPLGEPGSPSVEVR